MAERSIPEGLIKRQEIADAYADIATVENTQAMALSSFVQPVVNLPQKPPPARSNYFPFTVGGISLSAVGFLSNVGIQNTENFSRVIVQVNAITVANDQAADRQFEFRRQDGPITGITFDGAIVPYSDAGPGGALASLGMMRRNNTAVAQGQLIAGFVLSGDDVHTYPFEAVINNGGIWVSSAATNERVRALFHCRAYPIIFPQQAG